jgi:hypothetical protein
MNYLRSNYHKIIKVARLERFSDIELVAKNRAYPFYFVKFS